MHDDSPPVEGRDARVTPVFISYRRSETTETARAIQTALIARYGPRSAFLDNDSIPVGIDYRARIGDALRLAKVVLVVIGPTWGTVLGAMGKRRLDEVDDSVRVEVEAALALNSYVIPVLVDDTPMPTEMELPPAMRLLNGRNGIRMHTGDRLGESIAQLIASIDSLGAWIGYHHEGNLNLVVYAQYQLSVVAGSAKGYSLPLRRARITIGRASHCDMVLADERAASRTQCSLDWDENADTFVIHAFHPRGTYLNGDLIALVQRLLKPGDVIRIGASELLYDRIPGASIHAGRPDGR